MGDLFDVDPSKFNPRGVLYDPFTHLKNFQAAQARADQIRTQIGGLAEYTLNGNTSILPRPVWKPSKEQPVCVCPADIMAPPPPTVELADIEDYDSDPDYEMEIPDGNTRRKVRFVEPTNKKRGATRATRGSIQKSASTRKTSTSVTVKKGSIASQKPASTSHTSPKKKSGQSGSTPVSRMSSPRKRT